MMFTPRGRRSALGAALLVTALIAAACGGDDTADPDDPSTTTPTGAAEWPLVNFDLEGTRATTNSRIDSSTVADLEIVWTYEVPPGGVAGALATTPVIVDGVVWVSDLNSNVYGIDLSLGSQLVVFAVAMLTAVGAPGIPSAGMVTMIVVLESVGLPVEAIGILLAVDRFLDTFRTMANVEGDAVVAVAVSRT